MAMISPGPKQLGDLGLLGAAVGPAPGHDVALVQVAVDDAAQRHPSEVRGRVEVGDEGLQRRLGVVLRRGDALEQQVQQRLEGGAVGQPCPVGRPLHRGLPLSRHAVHDREVELVEVGVEVEEQLLHLVDHLGDAGVGAVDLVHDEDHGQVGLEGLAQHEAGLRQGPFGRVDEEQHAVDHRQPALHLTAEVGVARRVDDVDLHVAVGHRGVLGEDRDPLLPLEVHRVHDPLVDVLVRPEGARLPQHLVDEGGLAMVDVSHDGHVAQVAANSHEILLPCGGWPAYGRGPTGAASPPCGRRWAGRPRSRRGPRSR
jgi:hypothetical protein